MALCVTSRSSRSEPRAGGIHIAQHGRRHRRVRQRRASTVDALLSRGRHVVALDLPTLPHRAAAVRLPGRGVETVWGDVTDTRESHRLVGFQQRSFADYLVDLYRRYRWRRPVVWAVAPLIRWVMLRSSPYWQASRGSDTRRGRTPDRVGS